MWWVRTGLWGALGLAAVFGAAARADEVIPRGEETLTLDQAVAQGKVDVTVSSLGGALGSKIRVDVRSKVGHTVYVEVAPGTVFLSTGADVQNMTGGTVRVEVTGGMRRETSVMVLVDSRVRSFLVESFCLDYHKPAPRPGDRFRIALLDQRAMRILQAPGGPPPSLWAFQCALWMDRAGVSETELKSRYRVGDADLRAARQLLVHAERAGIASIPPGIPADVRVHVERVFAADPAVRREAVMALGRLGQRALPVLPLVQVNVDIDQPGRWSPAAMPPVPASPAEAVAMLRQANIPALQPLLESLAIHVGVQGAAEPRTLPGPAGGVLAEALIDNLKSPLPLQRRRAARLLGLSRQAKVVEPLIAVLGDEDAMVRQAAADSLARVTGQSFGADREAWNAWWAKNKDSSEPAREEAPGPTVAPAPSPTPTPAPTPAPADSSAPPLLAPPRVELPSEPAPPVPAPTSS